MLCYRELKEVQVIRERREAVGHQERLDQLEHLVNQDRLDQLVILAPKDREEDQYV